MPKSFYIIDGHAQIFRAYFAPFRDLSSPTGEPTKATYVFTQMLMNLIDTRKPDYLAMVIDSAGDEGVFRKQIYPEYKANRAPRPDDFGVQEERILQIVRDAGIPIFFKHGFEADDVIATMARRLCDQDFETFMVSKDKDLRQIVDHCTKMYDVQSDEVLDADKLEAKVGYRPEQAIEIQTLMGDAIDNVPGIPGIGEKTAAKLIRQYGNVDNVLKHVDELTPKMRENFKTHADKLPVARTLVTLRTDVEMDFDPESCRFVGLHTDRLKQHLQELGFKNLLTRMEGPTSNGGRVASATQSPARKPTSPNALPKHAGFEEGLFGPNVSDATTHVLEGMQSCADCTYTLVDTDEKLDAFLSELKQQTRFAFDTETDALGAMNSGLVGMSFSWKHGTGYYVALRGPLGCSTCNLATTLEKLKPILEDKKIQKVGHNIKYDLLVMRNVGVNVKGVVLDSLVAAFLLDAGRMQYGIDRLAIDLLRFQKIPTVDLLGKGKNQISMDLVPLDRIATYASEDADITLRLADLLSAKLDAIPRLRELHDTLENPLIDVLVEMEFNGVAVDPQVLREQSAVLGQRIDALRAKVIEQAGVDFNPDSPKQLGDVLFNRLKLKTVKKTKTGFSTDIEVLEKLADEHPVPRLIMEYRNLMKLKNTYLDNLTEFTSPRGGRIHGSFNQAGAATGRLSMSDPNLQNIPIRTDEGRRIRLAFVPGDAKKSVLLTADYSQIELRVLAHFTQEPALLKSFANDEDVHKTVASEVFGVPLDQVTRDQRGQAKTINFGIVYGVTAYGLARRIEGLSVPAAGELIAAYNRRFPSIHQFLQQCIEQAKDKGYVETIMGRRRPLPDIHSGVINLRNAAERMAINSVVQGSAADLIKVAMLDIHREFIKNNHPSKLLLQVHDELVFETPIEHAESQARLIENLMTGAGKTLGLTIPLKVEAGYGKNWQELK